MTVTGRSRVYSERSLIKHTNSVSGTGARIPVTSLEVTYMLIVSESSISELRLEKQKGQEFS